MARQATQFPSTLVSTRHFISRSTPNSKPTLSTGTMWNRFKVAIKVKNAEPAMLVDPSEVTIEISSNISQFAPVRLMPDI